jgi:aspartyl-tRNA synthetase
MQDLMLDAPSSVEQKQLDELHIQIKPPTMPGR